MLSYVHNYKTITEIPTVFLETNTIHFQSSSKRCRQLGWTRYPPSEDTLPTFASTVWLDRPPMVSKVNITCITT